jgi:hypothetical protein
VGGTQVSAPGYGERRAGTVRVLSRLLELEGIDGAAVDGVIASVGDTLAGRV